MTVPNLQGGNNNSPQNGISLYQYATFGNVIYMHYVRKQDVSARYFLQLCV